MDSRSKHPFQPYSAKPLKPGWRSGVVVDNATGSIVGRFCDWRTAMDMACAMNLVRGQGAS